MAQLPNSETKKQKKRKLRTPEEEDAPAETAAASTEESPKKKGRRQMVDETILGRYHQSQKLQGILKKGEDHLEEEEGEAEEESVHKSVKETTEVRVTASEQTQADQVLEDVNKLEREQKKKLAKEKKKFKAQQKKLQQKEKLEEQQQPKESKQEKALAYMKQWKRHRDEWKFKKINHIWLLKNWKHSSKISDKKFKTFLKYLKSTEQKSLALQRLQQEAKTIVDSNNSATAKQDDDADQEDSQSDNHQHSIERARSILQWTV